MEKSKGIGYADALVFDYKMSRHKVVKVSMNSGNITHRPIYGSGSKGFILTGDVISIDGRRTHPKDKRLIFALNTVIGHEVLRGLSNAE